VSSYVRRGGVTVKGTRYARSGGVLVEGRPRPFVPAPVLSALVYPNPPWSFSASEATVVETFSSGANRNRLAATGTTSSTHTLQRAFAVTAGATYRFSVLGQADTVSTFLGFEFYNGGTFLASAGRFNPTTGQATGTGVGALTDLGGGVYRYDKDYLAPSGVTDLNVRLLVGNASGTGSFLAAGEAVLVSELTLTPL
jgi:hypothetical protein